MECTFEQAPLQEPVQPEDLRIHRCHGRTGLIETIDISKELGLDAVLGFKLSLGLRFSLLNRSSGSNSLRVACFSEPEDDLE